MKTFDPEQVAKESRRIVTGRLRVETTSLDREDVVRRSVVLLDVLALSLAGLEAARELGLTTWEQVSNSSSWLGLTESYAGIENVGALFGRVEQTYPRIVSNVMPIGLIEPSLEQAAHIAQVLVSSFPVDEFTELARTLGAHGLAHSCRVSHSRLRSILYRIGNESKHRLAIAGRAFIEGRISASELASFLELDVPDAIALLEASNLVRPASAIQLSEDQRSSIYDRLRSRRLSGTRDLLDDEAIRREVLASNRIEGIGSRRWPK